MTRLTVAAAPRALLAVLLSVLTWTSAGGAEEPTEHPLEPPDRSSPRATVSTFHNAVDAAWAQYSAGDPTFRQTFREARECLDLREVPPLVLRQVAAESALLIKDVLDRIELPAPEAIPGVGEIAELAVTRWTVPHTEITLHLVTDGPRQGEWLFSPATVARAEEFFDRVRHLPYRPGMAGGHVQELRSASDAILLMKLVEAMPSWFKREVGGMLAWQWFGLGLFVILIALAIAVLAALGRRWRHTDLPGRRLGQFLVPLALMSLPAVGSFMIQRLFTLPGSPALSLELLLSALGFAGSVWLVGLAGSRAAELTIALGFRDARPLKQQLVRAIFRVATIVVITVIAVKALQSFGVPVAGLIAGLGVGGIAIALAAKNTLENFIGGIILYADQPVKVGDFCRFGDRLGTVEDVGLRSTRIRTLDRTLVTVPNADFAGLHIENLSGRDRILLREKIRLRYETTREQLEAVMAELEAMLRAHPKMSDERLRVRFNGFGESSQEVELYGYAETGKWPEFTKIREEVLLEVMAIIERSDTRLALPTEVQYVHGSEGAQSGT